MKLSEEPTVPGRTPGGLPLLDASDRTKRVGVKSIDKKDLVYRLPL